MTLRDIENDTLDALGYDSTTTATAIVRTRVRRQINWAHRQLLATPGLLRLLRDSVQAFTFTSVNRVARYGLPSSLGRINAITDPSNRDRLGKITLDSIREIDPDLSEVGPPSSYALLGIFPVRTQPTASASTVTIVSTDASDTTQMLTLELIMLNGDRFTHRLPLTGTVPATTVIATPTEQITRCYLSAPALGDVRLYSGTETGPLLVVIMRERTSMQYHHVQLWPTPAGPVTYVVDYTREIADLADPTDTPLVPPDFHELISVGAQMREWRKADDARTGQLQQEWESGVTRLKWWVINPAQFEGAPGQRSQLGPWFAAGT